MFKSGKECKIFIEGSLLKAFLENGFFERDLFLEQLGRSRSAKEKLDDL